MLTPQQTRVQINALINHLVSESLSNIQYYAIQRTERDDVVEITFPTIKHVTVALKSRSYSEIYEYLLQSDAYNVRMLDGALIQVSYTFVSGTLQRHRLAFFPAPYLEEFQKTPEVYAEDVIDADIVARNIVPFPLRFDYDVRAGRHMELVHPKSHLTLGQYEDCRIPVSSPVPPYWFFDFILRNFYNTADKQYTAELPSQHGMFDESILPAERSVVHIVVPA